jgi:IS30 family transposase
MLSQHGGIVPANRRRSLLTLTLAEREDISRGIASGSSIREIAKGLQRAVSTVSREVARHGYDDDVKEDDDCNERYCGGQESTLQHETPCWERSIT